jgi:hypothetical protein
LTPRSHISVREGRRKNDLERHPVGPFHATEKIPECQPHIERGVHLRLDRFSPSDYQELAAVFNGPHPETEEELIVFDEAAGLVQATQYRADCPGPR